MTNDPAADTAPFGAWPSPITAGSIVEGAATITEVVVDGEDVWWAEARPSEGGRTALLRRRDRGVIEDGAIEEVTPPGANVRTRVHEYGGGAWWVQGGVVVYSDLAAGQLLVIDTNQSSAAPRVLIDDELARFADGRLTNDNRWFVCVRELHASAEAQSAGDDQPAPEPVNELVAVALDGSGETAVLVSGADFVASPRLSPDGAHLAWIQWQHPDMPWDGTELWIAQLSGTTVSGSRRVAGGRDEALMQPEWSPSGKLHVISDRSGWWNLYSVDHIADRLSDGPASFELVRGGPFDIGGPMWVFGQSAYAFAFDADDTERVIIDQDVHATLSDPTCIRSRGGNAVVAGASWQFETHVAEIARDGTATMLRAPRDLGLDPAFTPAPEPITFPTGPDVGVDATTTVAHGLYYAPANPGHDGVAGERPPLLVMVHGGPTSAARRSLHLPVRYWTSRGFAVVDVDYRGSSGYGRQFRRALDGQWGVADVEDVVAAARFLAARGDVDPNRLLIRGGSAGGFTVLSALTFHDVFAAGASHYGIADLEALARDTHKFESRYLERLIGPYPQRRDVYIERSPINHTERLSAPMIVLQGTEDRVVPQNQADMMVAALETNEIAYAYVLFDGEGHGFRRSENIIAALEAELSFYAQLFGISLTEPIEPVPIHRRA